MTHISSRRSVRGGLVALTAIGMAFGLAGCEERLTDEIAFPRSKPARTATAPAPVVLQARVPGYAYAPWQTPDRYRSNCAYARC
jgi:hypothetical protein